MTEDKIIGGWTRGIDNKSTADRIPEGYVRDMLNFDPVAGKLKLRPQSQVVEPGTNCKSLVQYHGLLAYVDGTNVVTYNPKTRTKMTLLSVNAADAARGVPMVVHDGRLYIAASVGMYVFDGQTLSPWQKDGGGGALSMVGDRPEFTRSLTLSGCSAMASHNGVILLAAGPYVFMTDPLMPDRIDPIAGFFSFESDVGMLLSGKRGVYISADKCYSLRGVETESPEQSTVLYYPAVAGSGVMLPDGRAAWVTEYGMAVESTDPREGVIEPNKEAFVPPPMSQAASGVVEVGGVTRMVASTTPSNNQTGLAASDYFEAEVIRP